jgi:hypothetical protein
MVGGSTAMPASWRTGSNVPCTAMYRATAPATPATTSATAPTVASRVLR